MSYLWWRREICEGFRSANLQDKEYLKDLGVDGRIMLKWILKKLGRTRTGLI